VDPGRLSPTAARPTAPGGIVDEERERILRVLAEHGGNQTQAAKALGIARSTLIARLESYGVPRPRKPGETGE
jgi:transcriptional regulator of acetoin/glycerol metabolism